MAWRTHSISNTPSREPSFWLRRYGAYTPEPSLPEDTQADVAIIGGGFTGLSTAWHLKRADPGIEVLVLEAADIGFGASGRNGGFSMTLFGLAPEVTRLCFGVERTVAAHRYLEAAVDYVRDLVDREGIDSDYRHPGFLRVATNPSLQRRLEKHYAFLDRLGIAHELEWRGRTRMREDFPASPFRAGLFEPRGGLLNPAKHVREWKRLARTAGARIHEHTPVRRIERRSGGVTLHTDGGRVEAERVVLATNAWTHRLAGLRQLRSRQAPVWTYQIVTRPLTDAEWTAIGWRRGEGVEDNRQLIHYFRPTVDGRITLGGGDVVQGSGNNMNLDDQPRMRVRLERALGELFPSLAGVAIDDFWGGPVSATLDMVPVIGQLGDERVIYSCGCMGHGVSLTQYNGLTISELLLEKHTPRTDMWFVRRRPLPWPPEPLAWLSKRLVSGVLRTQDRLSGTPEPADAAIPERSSGPDKDQEPKVTRRDT